jgi:hypothetical protein
MLRESLGLGLERLRIDSLDLPEEARGGRAAASGGTDATKTFNGNSSSNNSDKSSSCGSSWGFGGRVIRLSVVDEDRSGAPVGTLLLHLHADGDEYPFTTLVRHGSLWREAEVRDGTEGNGEAEGRDGVEVKDDRGLPVVLIRIREPEEEAPLAAAGPAGPSTLEGGRRLRGPYFLRVLLHELGHALHYVCSGPASASTPSTPGGGPAEAEEAEAAAATWQLPFPPAPCLSAAHSPLDLRELPSHLLERWASDPACLQASPLDLLASVSHYNKPLPSCSLANTQRTRACCSSRLSMQAMSRHRRLAIPLPAREAVRLSRFLSSLFYATSLDLHDSVLAGLADLYMHGAQPLLGSRQGSSITCSASPATEAWERVWREHGILPEVPSTLERMRNLESLGTVRKRESGSGCGHDAALTMSSLLLSNVFTERSWAASSTPTQCASCSRQGSGNSTLKRWANIALGMAESQRVKRWRVTLHIPAPTGTSGPEIGPTSEACAAACRGPDGACSSGAASAGAGLPDRGPGRVRAQPAVRGLPGGRAVGLSPIGVSPYARTPANFFPSAQRARSSL